MLRQQIHLWFGASSFATGKCAASATTHIARRANHQHNFVKQKKIILKIFFGRIKKQIFNLTFFREFVNGCSTNKNNFSLLTVLKIRFNLRMVERASS
jgi:hypothetical protein